MKAENVYSKFLPTAKYLLKELDYYGVNQFKTQVPKQEWTIGKFYDYLLNSTLNFYLPQINACLKGQGGSLEGKKKAKGKFIFWYGRVPAIVNYKDVCDYIPAQPESPAKAKDNLYRFIKIMNRTAQEIDKSTVQTKIEHPDFG